MNEESTSLTIPPIGCLCSCMSTEYEERRGGGVDTGTRKDPVHSPVGGILGELDSRLECSGISLTGDHMLDLVNRAGIRVIVIG